MPRPSQPSRPSSPPTVSIAPGTRIIVREEEWLVRQVDRASSGKRVFTVTGLSPLVRDRTAKFIEDLEEDLAVVDPTKTIPVADPSPFHRGTRLHIEALLRETAPTGPRIHLGHRGAMDVLPYQLDPAYLALEQPRQRILIADSVGLGKTVECGTLLTELIQRGRGRRILVLAVKSMLTQFQKELWARFSIPLVRLDSQGIQRVRQNIPANHNPFHYYDRTIVSIDTIKQDSEYRTYLEDAWWDVIVIDEAHNVASRGGSGSLRAKVADLLAGRSDSLILLSATPHDGKRESFASIMRMLNPTAIKDEKDYGPDDIEGLFIRRFKKDVQDQVRGSFPERAVHRHRQAASGAEEAAFTALANLRLAEVEESGRGGRLLFRTTLEKALFSSPAACRVTIAERLKRIAQRADAAKFAQDGEELRALDQTLAAVTPGWFSKYQALLHLFQQGKLAWTPAQADSRVVIFTERIPTLEFLREQLPSALRLKENQIAVLHGGLSDIDQQRIVADFGDPASPLRLLIASDVASEGINLHYQSCQLVHFDIPWSLIVFQQRNGRIDRYGQERQPHIHYLLTESRNSKIRGDLRILELLTERDEQVQKNIGDPSEFTGIHDPEEEEARVGKAMEAGETPEEFDRKLAAGTTESDDPWLAQLLGGLDPAPSSQKSLEELCQNPRSLYPDDYTWAKAGLEHVRGVLGQELQVDLLDDRREIHLVLPPDLRRRARRSLPSEALPENGPWILSADRAAVMREIGRCRGSRENWPAVHLLWQQHPALIWLNEKILGSFGRAEAPVVFLPQRLKAGETIILTTGIIPNRKGHPLIQRWIGVGFENGKHRVTLDLDAVLDRTRFHRDDPPRLDREIPVDTLSALLPEAVRVTRESLSVARREFDAATRPELERQLSRLEAFRDARSRQLEFRFEGMEHIRESQRRGVERLVTNYRSWIEDTMKTEDQPSIRVVAFFTA